MLPQTQKEPISKMNVFWLKSNQGNMYFSFLVSNMELVWDGQISVKTFKQAKSVWFPSLWDFFGVTSDFSFSLLERLLLYLKYAMPASVCVSLNISRGVHLEDSSPPSPYIHTHTHTSLAYFKYESAFQLRSGKWFIKGFRERLSTEKREKTWQNNSSEMESGRLLLNLML